MDSGTLRKLIEKYLIDNPTSKNEGQLTNKSEFEKVDKKVLKCIPSWYSDILISYPLVGLEVGIPNDFGDKELLGKPLHELPLMGLTFISVGRIEYCSLNLFPDHKLIDLGHIRIAEDKFGTQEGIYIDIKEDNPSIKLVWHDLGETGKEVLKQAEILMENFTDIFKYGRKRHMDEE
jgi:hypothetical protein